MEWWSNANTRPLSTKQRSPGHSLPASHLTCQIWCKNSARRLEIVCEYRCSLCLEKSRALTPKRYHMMMTS
jgi:hypothetical protein